MVPIIGRCFTFLFTVLPFFSYHFACLLLKFYALYMLQRFVATCTYGLCFFCFFGSHPNPETFFSFLGCYIVSLWVLKKYKITVHTQETEKPVAPSSRIGPIQHGGPTKCSFTQCFLRFNFDIADEPFAWWYYGQSLHMRGQVFESWGSAPSPPLPPSPGPWLCECV